MGTIYSYVVRYDSGFAPNPFYGYCTLATCKPSIRAHAQVGDWIVGSGSNERRIRLGGHLVYAMKVAGVISFDEYAADPRFDLKKPRRRGSRKQSCGDNIYFRDNAASPWSQLDSFHSRADGSVNPDHVERDTGVNRILYGTEFIYYGGEGPKIPPSLRDAKGRHLCKEGIGASKFNDPKLVAALEAWITCLGSAGYQGAPYEWLSLRRGSK